MGELRPLGPLGRRLLGALLFVSLTVLAVHAVGTVLPHLLTDTGHGEAVAAPWLVAATLVAVVFAVVVSWLVSSRLIAPVDALLAMTRKFAAGDHSARFPDTGHPEFADLTAALNAAADEVEREERSRQRFATDIAHELRTPLTILQARLEEVRDGLVPVDSETLVSLHDQVVRLGHAINDLGQLAAAESPDLRLSLEEVHLDRTATLALDAWRATMEAAGLSVGAALQPGVVVTADPHRLHQVVANLLGNAAQYCRPGDLVEVRVHRDGKDGVLAVVDTGPGLDPDELPHAFDRTWRGRSSQGTSGSGLGLAIVRALVLAHHGTVTITSPPGGGAAVTLRLPLRAAA